MLAAGGARAAVRRSCIRPGVSNGSPLNALVTGRWTTVVLAADVSAVCRAESRPAACRFQRSRARSTRHRALAAGRSPCILDVSGVDYFWCER
jgi:hypothetical protein